MGAYPHPIERKKLEIKTSTNDAVKSMFKIPYFLNIIIWGLTTPL